MAVNTARSTRNFDAEVGFRYYQSNLILYLVSCSTFTLRTDFRADEIKRLKL